MKTTRRSLLLTILFGPALRRLKALPDPVAAEPVVTPWFSFPKPSNFRPWSFGIDIGSEESRSIVSVYRDGELIFCEETSARRMIWIPILKSRPLPKIRITTVACDPSIPVTFSVSPEQPDRTPKRWEPA